MEQRMVKTERRREATGTWEELIDLDLVLRCLAAEVK